MHRIRFMLSPGCCLMLLLAGKSLVSANPIIPVHVFGANEGTNPHGDLTLD